MKQISIRLHESLNDFLPAARRGRTLDHRFVGRVSVKDLIESLGVPHTEVAQILVNGSPVGFESRVQDGDRLDVFAESPERPPSALLRPRWSGEPRFVLDAHLGRLARYLRMLGFNTLYRNDYADADLARIAHAGPRILLTRDPGLLKRSSIAYGYFVRSSEPRAQAREILRRYALARQVIPFRRCLRCNGTLLPVGKAEVSAQLLPQTRALYERFHRCADCGQVYWEGSHHERMRQLIRELLPAPGQA